MLHDKYNRVIQIRVNDDMYNLLVTISAMEHRSVSQLARLLLQSYIENYPFTNNVDGNK